MAIALKTAPVALYQQTYHTLLDSFAQPGLIVSLPPAPIALPDGPLAYLAMIGMALLGRTSSFAALGPGSEFLADLLRSQTGATRVDPAFADVIFAAGDRDDLSCYPVRIDPIERSSASTTFVFGVRGLSTMPVSSLDHFLAHLHSTLLVSLTGPGASLPRRIRVNGLLPVNLARFLVLNAEHSRGADMLLVDGSGHLLGLTPLTHLTWHDVSQG